MGYFDGLTDACFKKGDDGKSIFYPYGIFGSGYILPEGNEIRIKFFLRIYITISLLVIIVSVNLFGLYSFILLFFLITVYSIKIRQMLLNTEKTQEKMKLKEVTKNMAISMGVPTSIFMLVASLLMISASIFCIFLSNSRLIGIFGTIFFGLGLLQSIFLVRYSIKFKKEK